MPQKLVPIADVSQTGDWYDAAFGQTDLYTNVDEAIANDADYILTSVLGFAGVIELQLSSGVAGSPIGDTSGIIIHARARSSAPVGTLTIDLYQGGTGGTLITDIFAFGDSNFSIRGIDTSFLNYSYELSASQAGMITDFSALSLVVSQDPGRGGDLDYEVDISQLYLEMPDAGGGGGPTTRLSSMLLLGCG